MNMWPVIARELRVEAKRPATYWLRTAGAAGLWAVALWIWLQGQVWVGNGGPLFGRLHLALLVVVWVLVPLMTADCISREKRQGTLGLLFLTPLKALDIVFAKGLAHGLRALMVCVGVLPVLAIPLLMGGVSALELAICVAVIFSSLCWALAAALWASALCKERVRALAQAILLALTFAWFSGLVLSFVLWSTQGPLRPARFVGWPRPQLTRLEQFGLSAADASVLLTNHDEARADLLARQPPAARVRLFWTFVGLATFSALALLGAVWLAALRLRRHWQPEPPSPRRLQWERAFCTPIYGVSLLKRWLRRALERNPVGWLEQRTWSGRLLVWSWLAILISFYTFALTNFRFVSAVFHPMQHLLAWVLVLSMAATAAGSFRRERETGVLELLLVSPLSERQIIGGRLRGLWGQFLPAIALSFGAWLYLAGALDDGDVARPVGFFAIGYLTLPVLGLYFSLRCRTPLAAFLWTVLVGLLAPLSLPGFVIALVDLVGLQVGPPASWRAWLWNDGRTFLGALFQLAVASYLAYKLHHDLRGRRFAQV